MTTNKLGIPDFAIKKRAAKRTPVDHISTKHKVLKYIEDHPKLSVYMVAEKLRLSKSSVYRYLKSNLHERGI